MMAGDMGVALNAPLAGSGLVTEFEYSSSLETLIIAKDGNADAGDECCDGIELASLEELLESYKDREAGGEQTGHTRLMVQRLQWAIGQIGRNRPTAAAGNLRTAANSALEAGDHELAGFLYEQSGYGFRCGGDAYQARAKAMFENAAEAYSEAGMEDATERCRAPAGE